MAESFIRRNRRRLGGVAAAGVSLVAAIPPVPGKRIEIVGGWVRAIGALGAVRMVDSAGASQDDLMQAAVSLIADTAGVEICFSEDEEYTSPVGLGISFSRSASFALEFELIYRLV